jgi:hypothetical protein
MLPGFRFLFAAIMLTLSILVFGLGAAALLRAAHEEFSSNPAWRGAPETTFAQPAETSKPVLAMLRVDTPVADSKPDVAAVTEAPAEPVTATPAAPATAEAEQFAARAPEDPSPPMIPAPEVPAASPTQSEAAAPASADVPAPEARDTTVATIDAPLPESQAAPATPEAASAETVPGPSAATKVATLGGPPVSIETPREDQTTRPVRHARNGLRKRLAHRAAQRRRMAAARTRLTVQMGQQPPGPFAQPTPSYRIR